MKYLFLILLSTIVILFILLRLEIIEHPMMNMSFRLPDKKIIQAFQHDNPKPKIKYHSFNGRTMRYLELIHDTNLPSVVFIHGAPGSLSDYSSFFKDKKLYMKANLISIDRLGYGYSEFGSSETSVEVQAAAIHSILQNVCSSKPVLVGHSYGGPIAVKMAMDYPGEYQSLILLAPAIDPGNEKEIVLAKLPAIKAIRWLIPPALCVASDEKLTHVEELTKMIGNYHQIKVPVCHIHGTEDSLVPFENLSYSIQHVDPALLETIILDKADHFLPWSHHDLIRNKILGHIYADSAN